MPLITETTVIRVVTPILMPIKGRIDLSLFAQIDCSAMTSSPMSAVRRVRSTPSTKQGACHSVSLRSWRGSPDECAGGAQWCGRVVTFTLSFLKTLSVARCEPR